MNSNSPFFRECPLASTFKDVRGNTPSLVMLDLVLNAEKEIGACVVTGVTLSVNQTN